MGGGAAADASIETEPGEIDRLVLLAGLEMVRQKRSRDGSSTIVAHDDANSDGLRLPKIQEQYEKVHGPKKLIILDGSAHAQYNFQTDQATRLMTEILRFLSKP